MSCSGNEAEEPRGERAVVCDALRMLVQELRGQAHEIVKATCCLQGCRSRDDGHDDEHHVDRHTTRTQSEKKYQDEHANHAVDTEADTSYAGTNKNQCQHDCQLNQYQCCCHKIVRCY